MAARRAKKQRRGKRKEPRFDWAGARRWAVPVLACVCVLALGAGMTVGIDRLDEAARVDLASRRLSIELDGPVQADGVSWVPESERLTLVNRARAILEGSDPFDVRPLRAVSELLEQSGWFTGRPTVRREGQSTIRIEGEWRRPAAVVRVRDRDYLISWKGMPMPMEFAAGGSGARTILGAGLSPAEVEPGKRYARPWPGTDVKAALDLLKLISGEPFEGQVAAVDVGGLSQGGGIVLITDRESRVVWGGAPGVFHAGEVGDEEKLARLRTLFEQYGRIDGGSSMIEINGRVPLRRRTDVEP